MGFSLQGYGFHVVGGDDAIAKIMEHEGSYPTGLRDAHIVIFSGGTDIQPTLYNEFAVHPKTQSPDIQRDRYEQAVYFSTTKKKLRVGICRGAQLLCVLNDGKLYQHVDGHHSNHKCLYIERSGNKRVVEVTSDHHQMMIVPKRGEIWGMSGMSRTKETGYYGTTHSQYSKMPDKHMDDPEIVWFDSTKTLCFQPHPEWPGTACRKLFFECISRGLR